MKEEKQIQDILAEYEEATSNRKGSLKSTRTTYAKRIAALYSSEPQCHKSKTCESYGDCAAAESLVMELVDRFKAIRADQNKKIGELLEHQECITASDLYQIVTHLKQGKMPS